MLIKIYWKCSDVQKEVYSLRKTTTKIMGFVYPISLKDGKYLPHWTYHSDRNRNPIIHHRARSGRILEFMTLKEPYLERFDQFSGIVWSTPSFGAPFHLLHAINVEGHPEEAEKDIIFQIQISQVDWTHYLHILLIERSNYAQLAEKAIDLIADGYAVINYETVEDGKDPNILVIFSQNKIDQTE